MQTNQKETKTNSVVKTQQSIQQDPAQVFTIQPKVQRKLGDEFTIDNKQVVVVEVNDGEYHVKNKNAPYDSFWI